MKPHERNESSVGTEVAIGGALALAGYWNASESSDRTSAAISALSFLLIRVVLSTRPSLIHCKRPARSVGPNSLRSADTTQYWSMGADCTTNNFQLTTNN